MERILLILVMATMATPAFAGDDGGFGNGRLSGRAPAALSDPKPAPDLAAKTGLDPASVEPASGEEDVPSDPEPVPPAHTTAPTSGEAGSPSPTAPASSSK